MSYLHKVPRFQIRAKDCIHENFAFPQVLSTFGLYEVNLVLMQSPTKSRMKLEGTNKIKYITATNTKGSVPNLRIQE